MREILFRGKRVDNGEWEYGAYIKATRHWHKHGIHEDWICSSVIQNGGYLNLAGRYPVKAKTVGQYTGRTDKNGEKVFEGDIVRLERTEWVFEGSSIGYRTEQSVIACDNLGMIGLVLEEHDGHPVRSDFFPVCELTDRVQNWSFEVIGNIHDNPELLDGLKCPTALCNI